MKLLIKNVLVIHEGSSFHDRRVDILIESGNITTIGANLDVEVDQVVKGQNLIATIGLCDIGTHSGEPGFEHLETVESLCKSALAGGYTALAVMPNLHPVTQTRSDINFLKNHPNRHGVEIYPLGALSKNLDGKDINEYFEMKSSGTVCYTDGLKPIENPGLLIRALQYASPLGGSILHHPSFDGHESDYDMHEGIQSTLLGLRGLNTLAENSTLYRDIELASYTNGHLIEHCISSGNGLKLAASSEGFDKIRTTVSYMNLLFTDKNLFEFDSNFKVIPVLRSEEDRQKLIEGIRLGQVDCIVSNHRPWDEEAKNLEFSYAKPGCIGLQTCLPASIDGLKEAIDLSTLLKCFTTAPREILNLEVPKIEENEVANLCIIDLENPWTYSKENNKSKSKNTPFFDHQFSSQVICTIHGKSSYFTM
ncbi:MAG: hypothetical protein H6567_08325 [Lewinellaceae bacterium]|nr:hypothetical protein [Lewinellaceae bacterium]